MVNNFFVRAWRGKLYVFLQIAESFVSLKCFFFEVMKATLYIIILFGELLRLYFEVWCIIELNFICKFCLLFYSGK